MQRTYAPRGLTMALLIPAIKEAVAHGVRTNAPLSGYHIPPAMMKTICKEEGLDYAVGQVELLVAGVPVNEYRIYPRGDSVGDMYWQRAGRAL